MSPRSLNWYRAQIDTAITSADRFAAANKYLCAVLADRDPGLADLALDKAADQILGLTEILLASQAVGAHEVLGMRYLPPHLEDPNRPGWLHPDELRRRRRSWAKCRTRGRMYEEIWATAASCTMCSLKFDRWSDHPVYPVIDHIVPLARGGTNADCNLQPLCESCNGHKGALL